MTRSGTGNARGSLLAMAAIGLAAAGAMAQPCPVTFTNFDPPTSTASIPQCVALGDLNEDGLTDLVTGSGGSGSVQVYLRVGGFFQSTAGFGFGSGVKRVLLVDVNHDNHLDVAAVTSGGAVIILLGNGNGTFNTGPQYPVGANPSGLVTGFFNDDANVDLAVACAGSSTISVLYGSAGGVFGPVISVPTCGAPQAIAAADFDGDGRTDLAVACALSGGFSVLRSTGPGFAQTQFVGTGGNPTGVAAGDLDGDGRPDLAATWTNGASGFLGVARNLGPGGLGTMSVVGSPGAAANVLIANFNGDGLPDIAVAQVPRNVLVYTATGNLVYGAPLSFVAASNANFDQGLNWMAAGEVNGDNRTDLAVTLGNSNAVRVLLGGVPTITQQPSSLVVAPGQSASFTVAATGAGLTYRWQRGGVDLSDSVRVSGSASPTLTINPVFAADAGTYACRIAEPCGAVATSIGATLSVGAVSDPCAPFLPVIGQQPVTQGVLSGATAVFSVVASAAPAAGSVTYQWRRNGQTLADGTGISGAQTAMLSVGPVALADDGAAFDCVVSTGCGSVRSDPAGLGVQWRCAADFNHSGVVSVQDIFDFIAAYFAGCP